jgi:hypothetical protein
MKIFRRLGFAALAFAMTSAPAAAAENHKKHEHKADAHSKHDEDHAAKDAKGGAQEVMEEALIQFWNFFKGGDVNRSGYIEKDEFFAHPVYEAAKWNKAQITFVFWMVDDNKDGKVSLQEWFNNELGQFQLGDKNHDGLVDQQEYDDLVKVQQTLFKDLNFPVQE